jgi:hypothetical protein
VATAKKRRVINIPRGFRLQEAEKSSVPLAPKKTLTWNWIRKLKVHIPVPNNKQHEKRMYTLYCTKSGSALPEMQIDRKEKYENEDCIPVDAILTVVLIKPTRSVVRKYEKIELVERSMTQPSVSIPADLHLQVRSASRRKGLSTRLQKA